MIFYFSGTGNSRYAARFLSQLTGEKCFNLPSVNPITAHFEGETLGMVMPVYSWGIPPIVKDFIFRLNETFVLEAEKHKIWVLFVCGDETAMAPEMLEKSLADKHLKLFAGWSLIMPNNYVLLPGFDVDSKEVEHKKLDEAPAKLREIAEKIKSGIEEKVYTRGSWPKFKSKIIYPLFCKWGVSTSKWRWSQECISCGKCASVCPVGNIVMKGAHPFWGKDCTSCLACYHVCPAHAIEYGNATTDKGQYFCHLRVATPEKQQ